MTTDDKIIESTLRLQYREYFPELKGGIDGINHDVAEHSQFFDFDSAFFKLITLVCVLGLILHFS